MTSSPFYDLVPKDPVENLRWRARCRERALTDKKFRDVLYQACMEDVLFFCAFALWVIEPRSKYKQQPMIPWSHQEPVILAMDETITEAMDTQHPVSLTLKKSRAQGGTYCYLAVTLYRAMKESGFTTGLVTRNEKLVDSNVNDSAVMYKVAWMLDRLPVWMLPDGYSRNTTDHVIKLKNESGWSGYSATGDVARGGRTSIFCFDEPGSEEFVAGNQDYKMLSSVAHVSNCLAGGTLVVTDRGLVPIEDVKLHDLVWDGNMWVKQDGCVYQGRKKTIRSYRIRLTPDHRVFTKRGWTHASEGFDREEIRLPSGYWQRHAAKTEESWECVLDSAVQVREGRFRSGDEFATGQSRQLPVVQRHSHIKEANSSRNVSYVDTSTVGRDEAEMHESNLSEVCRLRWEGNHTLRKVDDVREFHGGYGQQTERTHAGQNRQRQGLLTRELPLGDSNRTSQQPQKQSIYRDIARNADNSANCEHCRSVVWCNSESQKEGQRRGFATSSIQVCDDLTEPVYDLLNCGPRRAFTVIDDNGRPLLVHNCIFLVSTFGLDSGVFYESATDPDNPRVYNLSWKDNPDHSKNMYIVKEGVAVAFRPEEQGAVTEYIATHQREIKAIERRGHKIEGHIQSPWYNAHRMQPGATPRFIARELDEDCRGAVGKVFNPELLDRMKRQHCKGPVWVGNPVFDSETCKLIGLIPREDGSLRLWFKPGIDNSPPLGPFTAGADISSGGVGAYSSNSVLTALDDRTGEQVLEYTIKGLEPRPFARRCVGLCMWLRNALLGWEDSGVSGGYAKEIMEVLYYGNVFYRNVTQLGSQKKSRKPGWPCRDADKADMFEQMTLAMEDGKFVPRSEEMITECAEYEWSGDKIVHIPTKNKGLTEKNHADRCLIAGTMILTDKGEVPIEDVNIGDLVWTRNGLRPVTLCGLTGIENVIEVTLSNGRTLTGTGNHPVWTENRSWVNLQSLRPDDILVPCQTQQKNQSVEEFISAPMTPKQSCSMGVSTIVAQALSDDIYGCIFGVDQSTAMVLQSRCMLSFGLITTDLFRMVATFITRMKTHLTTTLPISNASLGQSMESFTRTAAALGARQCSMSISANIAGKNTRVSENEQPSFAAKHVERITSKRERVLFAKPSLQLKLDEQHRRVPQLAQSSHELGSTATLASSVANNTKHRERQRQVFAERNVDRVYVLKIENSDSQQEVYNLSVAETPEYFAQGILVHNCISAAGCWLVFNTDSAGDKIDSSEENGHIPEYGSFLWREQQVKNHVKSDSPRYGLRDVIRRY